MLMVGCASVPRVAHKHKGSLAQRIVAMRARKPERLVAVALANKLARIARAMISTGERFRNDLYFKGRAKT
jgi:transposase